MVVVVGGCCPGFRCRCSGCGDDGGGGGHASLLVPPVVVVVLVVLVLVVVVVVVPSLSMLVWLIPLNEGAALKGL